MPCEDTFYVCTIGSIYIGIPSHEVQFIIDPRPVSKIPLTPLYAVGAFIHQGLSTSVVDLREKFRLEKSTIKRSSSLIIMQLETDNAAAFFVDHISEEQELSEGKTLELFAGNPFKAVKQNEKTIYFTSLHYLLNASRDLFDNSKATKNIETIGTTTVINQQHSKNKPANNKITYITSPENSGEEHPVETYERTVILVDNLISKLPEHLPLAKTEFKKNESALSLTHTSKISHNTNITPINTNTEEQLRIKKLEEKQIELLPDNSSGDTKPLSRLKPPKPYFENEHQINNSNITNDEVTIQKHQGLESNFGTEERNDFQIPSYQEFNYSWIRNNRFIKLLISTINSPTQTSHREKEINIEVIERANEPGNAPHKTELLNNEFNTEIEEINQHNEITHISSDSNTQNLSLIENNDTIEDHEQPVNEKHNKPLSIKLQSKNRKIFNTTNSHTPIIVSSILLIIGGVIIFSVFDKSKVKELETLQNNTTLTERTPESINFKELSNKETAPVVLSIQSPEISIEVRRFEKQVTRSVDISLENSSQPAKATTQMVSKEIALPKPVQQQIIIHIVSKGDTFWKLALTHLENPFLYPEIANFNGIKNPNLIHPKDIVIIKRTNK